MTAKEFGKEFKIRCREFYQKHNGTIKRIVFFGTCGLVVKGSVSAIQDHKRLDKLEEHYGNHIKHDNEVIETYNRFVDWTSENIETLTRQNNTLLEEALKRTEGKAE